MKIVLAYSGGLGHLVILKWLKRTTRPRSSRSRPTSARRKNSRPEEESAGHRPSKIYVDDLQAEFAKDFIFPMMRANAIYEGQYFRHFHRPPAPSPSAWSRSRGRKARPPSPTAPPARGNDQVRFDWPPPPSPRPAGHRSLAHRGLPQPIPRPRRNDRLLRQAQDQRAGLRQEAPIPWIATCSTFPTRPASSRSVAGLLSRRKQGHVPPLRRPRGRSGPPRVLELEFKRGDCVAVNGQKLTPLEVMRSSTPSAASTASAAWTWSKTDSSA